MTRFNGARRKVSVFGDSISTYVGAIPEGNRLFYDANMLRTAGIGSIGETWWAQVIKTLGSELCQDAAFSGGMVEGAGFPAGQDASRAAQVADSDTNETPDDILILLGINDYGWGGAAAQAAGRSQATPKCLDLATIPEAVAGQAPDDAVEKFEAAYFETIRQLHQAAPDATLWCITLLPAYVREQPELQFCYQLRGFALDTYNDAIRAAAAQAKRNGIDARVADVYALRRAYESIDGTHPTKLGMQQLANMVVTSMVTEGACTHQIDANNDELLGKPITRECFKPTCIGCKFARDTGNTWSCVCERKARK